jgi:hypothetical protein
MSPPIAEEDRGRIIEAYRHVYEEIRDRLEEIHGIVEARNRNLRAFDVEVVALHIRKVCELICLGSLCASISMQRKLERKFRTVSSLDAILGELEKANPKFFPKGIDVEFRDEGRQFHISPTKRENLQRGDLANAFKDASELIHARNPLHSPLNYQEKLDDILKYQPKFGLYLLQHTVVLSPLKSIIVCDMNVKNQGVVVAWADEYFPSSALP